MRLLFRSRTTGSIGLALAAGTLVAMPAAATTHTSWSTRPSALPREVRGGVLNGVTALSPTNAWAVGYRFVSGHHLRPLIEHWDGTKWSRQASPNRTEVGTDVLAASALSPKDVWAVGTAYGRRGTRDTLVDHWDGHRWTRIPSPSPGKQASLFAVDAVTSRNVWAVGFGGPHSLIEHWDGKTWTIVPGPDPGEDGPALESVNAVSSNDAWIVGITFRRGGEATFTEHWDGTAWTRVASPNPGLRRQNELWGVTAVSANDVWAVGAYGGRRGTRTLIMHWDGTRWTTSPPARGQFATFAGVSSTSSHDVWAGGSARRKTLLTHWDGRRWTQVASPNPGHGSNLYAVSADTTTDAWAVGLRSSRGPWPDPLIEHWDGRRWALR